MDAMGLERGAYAPRPKISEFHFRRNRYHSTMNAFPTTLADQVEPVLYPDPMRSCVSATAYDLTKKSKSL